MALAARVAVIILASVGVVFAAVELVAVGDVLEGGGGYRVAEGVVVVLVPDGSGCVDDGHYRADLVGEDILGRKVDFDFIKYLKKLGETKGGTPCGEAGEYHTLVIDGPMFHERVEILETRKILREKTWILEILQAGLKAR